MWLCADNVCVCHVVEPDVTFRRIYSEIFKEAGKSVISFLCGKTH